MHILVTGGAGFIGSHVCEALLRRGDEVLALDNFDDFYPAGIKRANLKSITDHPHFRLIEGDIRDSAVVAQCVDERTDAIVHLAARAGVRPSIEQPLLYQDVNVRGTLVLLERCKEFPRCRFVFASSSSVYGNRLAGGNRPAGGNRGDEPFRETDRVDDPISPYAATKKAGELLAHTYHHLFGIPMTCLRFFTVYGPRQRPDLAIHKFARLMLEGSPIPVFGDGSMERDFTYIDDIVDGVLRAMDRCAGYRIYNLGQSRPVTVTALIEMLQDLLGQKAVIHRLPLQPGDVARTFADVTWAERELGYQPRTELRDGLRNFVAWLRQRP